MATYSAFMEEHPNASVQPNPKPGWRYLLVVKHPDGSHSRHLRYGRDAGEALDKLSVAPGAQVLVMPREGVQGYHLVQMDDLPDGTPLWVMRPRRDKTLGSLDATCGTCAATGRLLLQCPDEPDELPTLVECPDCGGVGAFVGGADE